MNRETEFAMTHGEKEIIVESGAEFVLPDYNGEVRKILYSEAMLRPVSKFIGDEEIEFSGGVVYKIIYSDAEGKITGTEFTSDYDYSVKHGGESTEAAELDMRVSNFAIRLLGPRRFSAKASLYGKVCLTERIKLDSGIPEESPPEEVEKKNKTVSVRCKRYIDREEKEINESLGYLEGVTEDEVRIIYTHSKAAVESYTTEGSLISMKAMVDLKCVIEKEGGAAYAMEKSLPLELELTLETDACAREIIPRIEISTERFAITPDEIGSDIVASVVIEYGAVVDKNVSVELVEDAFLTTSATENTYSELVFSMLGERISARQEHNAEVPRGELSEGVIREAVMVNAFPKIESATIEDDKAVLVGEIKYIGVTSEVNDDGSIGYSPLKYTAEFKENVNITCQNLPKLRMEAGICADEAEVKFDADKAYFTSKLRIEAAVVSEDSARVLSGCAAIGEGKYEKEKATVKVYYPEPGEDVFSVAKRFHTTVARISLDNAVSLQTAGGEAGDTVLPKRLIIY